LEEERSWKRSVVGRGVVVLAPTRVSRDHSPGLSVSRACKVFAVSGAKHAVPLFRFRLRLKPDSKILCRDLGQDARKSTYGVCNSRLDVARCRTFCQVTLFDFPCAFLGAGENLRKGLVQPPGLVLRALIGWRKA